MNEFDRSTYGDVRRWSFSVVELLSGLYLIHKLIPAIGAVMPSFVYLVIFGLTILLTISKIKVNIGSKAIIKLMPLFLVSVLYFAKYIFAFDFSGALLYLYGELQILLYGLIALAFISGKDWCSVRRFFKFILACYVFTAITTIIGCEMYPNAARILATNATSTLEYNLYTKNNIGGFSFIYEITLLTPIVICMIKHKKIGRIVGTAILIIFGYTIFKSEYTIALILFALSLVTCFIPKWNKKKLLFVLSILAAVLIFYRPYLSEFFSWLSASMDSETISSRFNDIASILNGAYVENLGSGGNRTVLYRKSWDAFVSSGFLGVWNSGSVGGHSFILDCLGYFGILGLFSVIGTFRRAWTYSIRPYKYTESYSYLIWIFIMAVIMAVMNPKSNIYIFMFLIPMIEYTVFLKLGSMGKRRNIAK